MDSFPHAGSPSVRRNRGPILEVLRRHLPAHGAVLEIASGTGEHVIFFAAALPQLVFQPSDPDPAARAGIAARVTDASLANLRSPLALDARLPDWNLPRDVADSLVAVICINMVHIAPWAATLGLMQGAAGRLPDGGLLYLYGAYRRDGRHTAPSNEVFDRSLRARNPDWGVRALEDVRAAAQREGFALGELVEMPANNLSVVLRRNPR